QGRQGGAQRDQGAVPRGGDVRQVQAEQLDAGTVRAQDLRAALGIVRGAELEHHRQVVRQLLVPDLEARGAEVLLDAQQRHAAAAGVAVAEVGQVQASPAAGVEGVDVLLLDGDRVPLVQQVDGAQQRAAGRV